MGNSNLELMSQGIFKISRIAEQTDGQESVKSICWKLKGFQIPNTLETLA